MSRWVVVAIVTALVALVLLGLLILNRPAPEAPQPTDYVTPQPAPPQPEPSPWIEDNDLPPRPPTKIPTMLVCCCGVPGYAGCRTQRMSEPAAALHAYAGYLPGGHARDLFGMACASEAREERALRRVLFRPERIEMNSRNTLSMADRAAYRERTH